MEDGASLTGCKKKFSRNLKSRLQRKRNNNNKKNKLLRENTKDGWRRRLSSFREQWDCVHIVCREQPLRENREGRSSRQWCARSEAEESVMDEHCSQLQDGARVCWPQRFCCSHESFISLNGDVSSVYRYKICVCSVYNLVTGVCVSKRERDRKRVTRRENWTLLLITSQWTLKYTKMSCADR